MIREYDCGNFKRFELKNEFLFVEVINYGGTITKIITKDKFNNDVDVVLGYDTLEEYQTNDGYFGAIIGRVANRIGNATFMFNNKIFSLYNNDRGNCLHGGKKGFNTKLFKSKIDGEKLVLSYCSPDLEEGFPGELNIEVIYELNQNSLEITYKATTPSISICNLTNHTYFNLDHSDNILDTIIGIKGHYVTAISDKLIPTGEIINIDGTCLDFNAPKKIGKNINDDVDLLKKGNGYDHNYVLDKNDGVKAMALSEKNGIKLEVRTNQEGLQFYSGNFISRRNGKYGEIYDFRKGFCFETQSFPDAINHQNFPSIVITKEKPYFHKTSFTFSIEGDK